MRDGNNLMSSVCAVLLLAAAGCRPHERTVTAAELRASVAPTPASDRSTVIEEHWPNGQLKTRKEVLVGQDGQPVKNPDGTLVNHGLYTAWHNNGQKAYEATYADGRLQGVETAWHKNGQTWTEAHYQNGLRHGPRYSWDERGRKRQEEHYLDDKPNGTWTVWDDKGKVKWQGTFERGLPVTPDNTEAGSPR